MTSGTTHGMWCVGVTMTFRHSTLHDLKRMNRHVHAHSGRFAHVIHVRVFCRTRREVSHPRIEVHSRQPCTTTVLAPRETMMVWTNIKPFVGMLASFFFPAVSCNTHT